jgi:NAD(P)-dependent dehydrogenase (short-subunit alcohol dehydrogenase family)
MKAIILGDKSDIAQGLKPLLQADGYEVLGWNRESVLPHERWDLVISALGKVAPVGQWWRADSSGWINNANANVLLPMTLLTKLWILHNPDASVCFLAGSNPQKIMPGYAPYNAFKMALLKVVEQLDAESIDAKIFALGPGYMDTKIHKPTLDAGWPNERIARGNPNTIEQVYDCLKWCISQPKEVVGGRNICVSDSYGAALAERLTKNPNLFKLRRVE